MRSRATSILSKTLATFLPGIFLIGYNIGTGSLTAMSKNERNINYKTLIIKNGGFAILGYCVDSRYAQAEESTFNETSE
ncbi:MAG: hypothetical protein ABFS32_12420 [Bacteroidota bacterium]